MAAGASVVAVKVLHDDPAENTYSIIIDGVDYVAGKASSDDIVNMSLGDPTPDNDDIDQAVINAANNGIRIVLAAGNESQNAGNVTPARVDHPNVWTISASDQNDNFVTAFSCNPSRGSNYGNPPIEYAAPGNNIFYLYKNGGTANSCGTSMAAPHVAGLLLAVSQDLTSINTVSNDPDSNPDPIAIYSPFGPPNPGGVSVSLSGPSSIFNGETETYSASASGGSPPYSYTWYYTYQDCAPGSPDCSDEGVRYVGGTGTSFQMSYTSNYDEVLIEVQVTDDNSDTDTDSQLVQIKDQNP